MLTFLAWTVSVYAVIWVVAAIFFYCINRKYSTESSRRSQDACVAAVMGLFWPVVLVQLVWLAWRGFRDRD